MNRVNQGQVFSFFRKGGFESYCSRDLSLVAQTANPSMGIGSIPASRIRRMCSSACNIETYGSDTYRIN